MIGKKRAQIILASIVFLALLISGAAFFLLTKTPHQETASLLSSTATQTPDTRSALLAYEGNRLVSERYGFSFEVPEGFQSGTFPAEQGEVFVIEKSPEEGFQIYVSPFDEEGPLTVSRIKADLPTLAVGNPKDAKLDSVPALIFSSANGEIGPTVEVWTVYPESPLPHGNYLFQIMTYAPYAEKLFQVLQTWNFE